MTVRTMPYRADGRRLAERGRSARLVRDALALLQSKWCVDVLLALGDGQRRYHELLAELSPISEKVLTQTLRAMERDGLIARRVHAEVPPRVEYALTQQRGRARPVPARHVAREPPDPDGRLARVLRAGEVGGGRRLVGDRDD